MVMVIQSHFSGRKINMINSANVISQQITFNVISDPNKWSHSYVGRKQRKTTKKNGKYWWWYDTIVLVEKQTWYIERLWLPIHDALPIYSVIQISDQTPLLGGNRDKQKKNNQQ